MNVFHTALGIVRVCCCLDLCIATHQNLIEEVLDELFLKRSRGEESMEIGTKKFRDWVRVRKQQTAFGYRSNPPTYMSSNGEMKISLKLMTCADQLVDLHFRMSQEPYIFVLQVFEQLQLSVGSLLQNWSAERFHYFLDRNSLVCELIFCRAACVFLCLVKVS